MNQGICAARSCRKVFAIHTTGTDAQCNHCGYINLRAMAEIRYADSPGRNPPTHDPIMDTASTPAVNPKTAQGNKKFALRLLPLPAEVEVNRALEDGLKKYGAANWRESGVPATVYVDAARRHLAQWFDGGQERASDSGVHNLGHAMACLAILLDAQWNNTMHDDRPAPCRDTDALLLRSQP